MRIISWNVNGLRAVSKKGALDWLKNETKDKGDIICFQETKCTDEQVPADVKEFRNFSFFDHSKTRAGYSGVGVLSDTKPQQTSFVLGDGPLDQEGRLADLVFDNFRLLNVYFPNGGGGEERLKFKMDYYDLFLKKIIEMDKGGVPIIFCGDINTAHNEIDLARPKENEKNTGFLPQEREWLDEVVASGFVDVFRYFYPEKRDAYTYWDQKTRARERNVGWRIDYFFVSKRLLPKINSCGIMDNVYGSDHCPIWLDLTF